MICDHVSLAEGRPISVVYGAVGDFDFFEGSWSLRLRRRLAILRGSDEWYDVSATCSMRKLARGLGNVRDFRMMTLAGEAFAMTLRLFNPRRGSGASTGRRRRALFGLFQGPDVCDGSPIVARFSLASQRAPALGADVLRRRRAHMGEELDDRVRSQRRATEARTRLRLGSEDR
jgi:hypothetical protein